MRVHTLRRFPYAEGNAWCDVDVYRVGEEVLVVLRDQDDHLGPSVTNRVEEVAREVREEVLEPLGLSRLTTTWIHWSRSDGVFSQVLFGDPERLERPVWKFLSPEALEGLLERFGVPGELQRWIQEGGIVFRER